MEGGDKEKQLFAKATCQRQRWGQNLGLLTSGLKSFHETTPPHTPRKTLLTLLGTEAWCLFFQTSCYRSILGQALWKSWKVSIKCFIKYSILIDPLENSHVSSICCQLPVKQSHWEADYTSCNTYFESTFRQQHKVQFENSFPWKSEVATTSLAVLLSIKCSWLGKGRM